MSGFGAETKMLLQRGHRRGDFSDAKVTRKFGDVPDDLVRCDRQR
jgi:hypothetical protein